MATHNFEIVIVGAGVVGLTAALAFAREGFSLCVIDKGSFTTNRDKNAIPGRVFAVTRAAENIFKNLNVWSSISAKRISPYQQMQVWDENSRARIHFDRRLLGEANLGYIIEDHVLQTSLLEQLQTYRNVSLYPDCQLSSVSINSDAAILTDHQGQTFQSKLLIGADGANSWLRQQLKVNVITQDYQHHAITATIQTEFSHEKTAWQRFLADGVLALLPLSDPHQCSIVWSTSPEHTRELMELSPDLFATELTKAFANKLGALTLLNDRSHFPLHMRKASQTVGARFALIGDAAHTLHPLAGQGVNLGILDAATLVEVLATMRDQGKDLGDFKGLRRYERWRRGENQLMIDAMSAIKNLFAAKTKPMKMLRSVGLHFCNHVTPVKKILIQRAMGLAGDLPKLTHFVEPLQ